MKTATDLRNALGLTQQEMALLLRITRSQWSMYESGLRDLPVHALTLLSEVRQHEQDTAKHTQSEPQFSKPELELQLKHLKQLLHQNERQQAKLEKLVRPAKRKLAEQPKRQQLGDFLNKRNAEQGKAAITINGLGDYLALPHPIDTVASLNQELKQQMLAFEKKLLEEKMQELKQQLPTVKE